MSYIEFSEMIEWDYMYFLYMYCINELNKNNPINFPYCCHLSANLIASYLSVHFDSTFKHKEYRNWVHIHGWTESPNEMIDFTSFHNEIPHDAAEKIRDSKNILSYQEFKELVQSIRKNYPIIQPLGEYDWFVDNGVGEYNDIKLYGIEFAKRISKPYEVKEFLKYVEEALPYIEKKVKNSTL
ncbi:hypothetical protein [Niallia sp. 03190]|uniref:hypothetical protein n=2 Tax=unclassified Niallia TaxID=2837522 RepID=UPI004044C37D